MTETAQNKLCTRWNSDMSSNMHAVAVRHRPIINKSASLQLRRLLRLLRPLARAYVLGYASSTTPRLLTLLVSHLTKKTKEVSKENPEHNPDHLASATLRILRGGLHWQRFPTFCAALVGGSTLLQVCHHVFHFFFFLPWGVMHSNYPITQRDTQINKYTNTEIQKYNLGFELRRNSCLTALCLPVGRLWSLLILV